MTYNEPGIMKLAKLGETEGVLTLMRDALAELLNDNLRLTTKAQIDLLAIYDDICAHLKGDYESY